MTHSGFFYNEAALRLESGFQRIQENSSRPALLFRPWIRFTVNYTGCRAQDFAKSYSILKLFFSIIISLGNLKIFIALSRNYQTSSRNTRWNSSRCNYGLLDFRKKRAPNSAAQSRFYRLWENWFFRIFRSFPCLFIYPRKSPDSFLFS